MGTLKQRVQISSNKKSVVVVDQEYNEAGIAIGQGTVGVINFDAEVTTVKRVYDYAKTRKWELTEGNPPNNRGIMTPVDMGPLNPEEATELNQGQEGLGTGTATRTQHEVNENEIVS